MGSHTPNSDHLRWYHIPAQMLLRTGLLSNLHHASVQPKPGGREVICVMKGVVQNTAGQLLKLPCGIVNPPSSVADE
jgi:hypothetical protein